MIVNIDLQFINAIYIFEPESHSKPHRETALQGSDMELTSELLESVNIDAHRLSKCKIKELPKITDKRGNLTFIEGNRHVPFQIRRAYYLYEVPEGESRGGHAHKELHQFIIAAAGEFDVDVDDGQNRKRFHLNQPCCGLYVPPMVWRELANFSSRSLCLVLASEHYDESDYIRDYETFKKVARRDFWTQGNIGARLHVLSKEATGLEER